MANVVKKELTLDSREVAEMVGKRHSDLLRDIETYISYISQNANLRYDDFFLESSYRAGTGKAYKCYQVTRKGCEFIAHKLTGQKGAQFTATYINRFHEMEQALSKQDSTQVIRDNIKAKEIEARLKNANSRQAKLLMQIADKIDVPEYKQVLNSYATEIITGKKLLPLPEVERHTYSAEEIGKMLGISANMVGRLANRHNLKTSEFGKVFYDKAKYCNKQVETFRYYDNVVPILEKIIAREVQS